MLDNIIFILSAFPFLLLLLPLFVRPLFEISNFSTALLLALPLFSSQHKNSSHLYPCLFQCCSSLSIHNGPLLHFKLKIQYYRIPSHISFASTCICRQKCNVLYLSRYSTLFIHTFGNTKTKHFNTITAAQSVLSMQ